MKFIEKIKNDVISNLYCLLSYHKNDVDMDKKSREKIHLWTTLTYNQYRVYIYELIVLTKKLQLLSSTYESILVR